MFELPTTITIQGEEYAIRNKGDFRTILDCFNALQDEELPQRERVVTGLLIFYDTFCIDNVISATNDVFNVFNTKEKLEEAVTKMYEFFSCNQKTYGNKTNYKLIDWEQDAHLIASAVNKVANTEIRSVEYMHWWTFMGYYISVGESTLLSVVTIRSKIVEGKKLEKYEQEFRRRNPEYFSWNRSTVDQREADLLAHELWNKE